MAQRFRFSPAFDLRAEAESRVVSGTALRYGNVAVLPWGRERFEAHAFQVLATADVILNRQHQRHIPLARTGAGLVLVDSDTALSVRAELPRTRDADDVLELIGAGILRGLSIEFLALRSRIVDGVEVISRAKLGNIGIVDRPSYSDSLIAREQAMFADLSRAAPAQPPFRLWL